MATKNDKTEAVAATETEVKPKPVRKPRKPRTKKPEPVVVETPVPEPVVVPEAPAVVEIPEPEPAVEEVVNALEDANIPEVTVMIRSIAPSKIWTSNDTLKPGDVAKVSRRDAKILIAAGLVERI
jgi:hypothetical protein